MYEGCEACAINLLIGDEWFPDQDVRLACLTAVSALFMPVRAKLVDERLCPGLAAWQGDILLS